jgi:hypothetical protein
LFSNNPKDGKASTPPGCKEPPYNAHFYQAGMPPACRSSITIECLLDNQIMMDHYATFSMEALDVLNKNAQWTPCS